MNIRTPVHFVEQFSSNKIYMKRDDLLPFSFGGNKARKAELFFREVQKETADVVVTYGSSSSNHCRITANKATEIGCDCIIITPDEKGNTFNRDLTTLMNAKFIECSVEEVSSTIEKTLSELKAEGRTPYFIPGGGHGKCGTEAYCNAYEEILTFEKETGTPFDYIFLASGTGTTQAGLIVGKFKNHTKTKIVGISIAREKVRGSKVIRDSIRDYLGPDVLFDSNEVIFIDDYLSGGYGKGNDQIEQTIISMLLKHGIPLDHIYTGKAYCGMQQYILSEGITGSNILFIHTGGTPIFFDNIDKLSDRRKDEYTNFKRRISK